MLRGSAVQRSCQLGDRRIVSALVRPLLFRRRHLTRAQFSDNAFPGIRVVGHVFVAKAVEVQSALLDFAVVAGDAILAYDGSQRRGRRWRWTGGGRLRPDGATNQEQNRYPAEATNSQANHVSRKLTEWNLRFQISEENDFPGKPGQEKSQAWRVPARDKILRRKRTRIYSLSS